MNMFLGAQFTYCEFCRENLISRALGSVYFCKDGLCRIENDTLKYRLLRRRIGQITRAVIIFDR